MNNFYYYTIRDANSELFCSAELTSIAIVWAFKNLRLLNTRNALNNTMLTDSDAIPSHLAGPKRSSGKGASNR